MDMYAKLKDLDRRVQDGELKLVEVMDELRLLRAERLSRQQVVAATDADKPVAEPQKPARKARG